MSTLEARRLAQDRLARRLSSGAAFLPVVLIIVIVIALAWRSGMLLGQRDLRDLLLGRVWRPQMGEFGFYPFIVGTFWVTLVAVTLATPPCLLTAIYLAEYAPEWIRSLAASLFDLLAAIPSVVYGVWGVLVIVPWIKDVFAPWADRWLGFLPVFASHHTTGYSLLAGGIVLAIMIAPSIISIVYEVMGTMPKGLRHASLAVGATRWETVKFVLVPYSLPGMIAGVILGATRALGETMAVLMVVGNVARLPSSLFDPVYPLTALIANNYGEMLSIPKYDAALMSAALILLLVVLLFNTCAAVILKTIFRRAYLP